MTPLLPIALSLAIVTPDAPTTTEPDWSRITHGNWSVWVEDEDGTTRWDPVGSYNAWIDTIPFEDRAWPEIIDCYHTHADIMQNEMLTAEASSDVVVKHRFAMISTPEAQAVIERIARASERPHLGFGLYRNITPDEHEVLVRLGRNLEANPPGNPAHAPSLLDARWPLHELSTAAYLLVVDAGRLARAGDHQPAIDRLEQTHRLIRLARETPGSFGHVRGLVLNFDRSINWIIAGLLIRADDQLDDTDLARLDALLARRELDRFVWEGEALWFHDMARGIYDAGLVRPPHNPGADPEETPPTSTRDDEIRSMLREFLAHYDGIMRHTSSLIHATPKHPGTQAAEPTPSHDAARMIESWNLEEYRESGDMMAQAIRIGAEFTTSTRLAIAASRHRLRHNAWPATIDAIDDDLITFDPVQLDLGIPLGYRLSDRPDWSGPVIYRFGNDGDDDGGEHANHSIMIPNTDADSTPPPEGDWVFFPYRGSTTSIIFED